MPNPVIVQGAIKYATQRHRIALAERLGEVMNKKLAKDVEEDEDNFDIPDCEDFSESLISKTSTPRYYLYYFFYSVMFILYSVHFHLFFVSYM